MTQSSFCFLVLLPTCLALHARVPDDPKQAFRNAEGAIAQAVSDLGADADDIVVPDAVEALRDSSIKNMIEKSGLLMDEQEEAGVASMLSNIRTNNIKEYSSPIVVLGFLRMNKGNVKKSLQMHMKAAEWRRNYPGSIRSLMKEFSPADEYTDDEVRSSKGCTDMYRIESSGTEGTLARKYACMKRLKQTNSLGEVINVVTPYGITRNGVLDQSEFMERATIAYYEDNYQCMLSNSEGKDNPVYGHSIVDLQGIGITDLTRVPKAKVLIRIVQNYPELMKSVAMINAPRVFAAIFKLVLPMIPPSGRDMIRVSSGGFNEEMQKFSNIDITTLPKRLGGEASDDDLCVIGEKMPTAELPSNALKHRAIDQKEDDIMTWDVNGEDQRIVQQILRDTEVSL